MSARDLSRLEDQITGLLRFGVLLSATTLAVGLGLEWAQVGRASAVLDTGLILLMSIPIARIAASFVDALRRADRLLIWSTAFVLMVMAVTLVISLR